jgi:hypothetical protein
MDSASVVGRVPASRAKAERAATGQDRFSHPTLQSPNGNPMRYLTRRQSTSTNSEIDQQIVARDVPPGPTFTPLPSRIGWRSPFSPAVPISPTYPTVFQAIFWNSRSDSAILLDVRYSAEESMSVESDPRHLVSSTASIEARFDDGYRYFDRCGAAISKIRAMDAHWVPAQINLDTGTLIHDEIKLVLRMNHERLILSKNGDEWISHLDAEKLAQTISEKIEPLYSIVTSTFEVPNTIRIGARFSFLAPASSVEDAQLFVVSRTGGQFRETVESCFSSKLVSGNIHYEIEDETTGYRRNVMISTAAKRKGLKTRVSGFDLFDLKDAAIQIDVDLYTRPSEGHFSDAGQFVRTAFATAREGALKILRTV